MSGIKPKLSVHDQVEHLKSKGVLFTIMSEEEAEDYLRNRNNYFKLAAYRKNYPKNPGGENAGKYIKLEFAYLKDLAIIDMELRYQIVHMALDIEHYVKIDLLQKIEDCQSEDGYQIVEDYNHSLPIAQQERFAKELERNRQNIYCGGVYKKYADNFPIWALIEIIPFGRLIDIYKFSAYRFDDQDMKDNYYRLLTCREIRNASAHSNCILNDLAPRTALHKTNGKVTQCLMSIQGMNSGFRRNRMSNARIQEIVTLLYTHKTMVKSRGIHESESEKLHKVVDRMFKNEQFYKENDVINGSFDFLRLVVDSWF